MMRQIRRFVFAAAVSTAGVATIGAGAAVAHSSSASTSTAKPALAACSTTLPLTTPCQAAVTSSAGTYTVTVPGVGTVSFTLSSTDKPTGVTATAASGFTAGTPKVVGHKTVVTFTSTSDPTQTYTVVAGAHTASGSTTPTVKAVVVTARTCTHPQGSRDPADHDRDTGQQASVTGAFHHGGGNQGGRGGFGR